MITDIKYERVIPRDLFNEAKLLKCFGLLILKHHDNQTPLPFQVIHDFPERGFQIGLRDDGCLTITNMDVFVNLKRTKFFTTYNSKSNFPLQCEYNDTPYTVFNDAGEWDEEFLELCESFKK